MASTCCSHTLLNQLQTSILSTHHNALSIIILNTTMQVYSCQLLRQPLTRHPNMHSLQAVTHVSVTTIMPSALLLVTLLPSCTASSACSVCNNSCTSQWLLDCYKLGCALGVGGPGMTGCSGSQSQSVSLSSSSLHSPNCRRLWKMQHSAGRAQERNTHGRVVKSALASAAVSQCELA